MEIRRGGKYLTFMLGAEGFGIPIRKVREIIGMMDITATPRTPTHIKGVINLRGQVIEVIDLRAQFGLPETARTEATCIIVVETSSRGRSTSIGLIVDCVSEVLNIADESIEDAPSFGMSVDSNFILGMAKAGQNVKVLLDIERILSTDGAGPVANSSSATTATAIIALA